MQSDLAALLQFTDDSEIADRKLSRQVALDKVHDAFYKREIAAKIAAFQTENGGFLPVMTWPNSPRRSRLPYAPLSAGQRSTRATPVGRASIDGGAENPGACPSGRGGALRRTKYLEG